MEEEVEYHLCEVLDDVKKKLEAVSVHGEPPRIVVWRTPFYDCQVMFMYLLLLQCLFLHSDSEAVNLLISYKVLVL